MSSKEAAIWARVSGADQQSLPSQVAEVREWLESLGWTVPPERIITVDWTSRDILRCPQMQQLLGWVSDGKVGAVGSLHLDRFAARPGQVAQILDVFRQTNVELLLKQTPLEKSLMGELMGMVITIGKALQVDRAGAGAAKGLHDRPNLHRLPVSFRRPYGYVWEKSPLRLVPNENWDTANYLFREGLRGTPSRAISRELKKRGIRSPMGREEWGIQTIMYIFKNPLYGGRFHALRCECTEPVRRKGNTYGKSSERYLPSGDWVYLPEVEVVDPPLSWDEWQMLQQRLQQNRLLAQRNARRDYLLRGLAICDVHKRRFQGSPRNESWQYVCPVGKGCSRSLNGPSTEERAKWVVSTLLNDPDIVNRLRSDGEVESSIQKDMKSLEAKRQRSLNSLVELEHRHIDNRADEVHRIDPEVYARLKRQYSTQCQWASERIEELRQQLANMEHQAQAVASLQVMRDQLLDRLSEFSTTDWRKLFTDLGMTVHVEEDGNAICHFSLPYRQVVDKTADIVSSTPWGSTRHR